jgi:hypothetical protein
MRFERCVQVCVVFVTRQTLDECSQLRRCSFYDEINILGCTWRTVVSTGKRCMRRPPGPAPY